MVFKATKLILDEMEKKEMPEFMRRVMDEADRSAVVVFCPVGKEDIRQLQFISRDDDSDVSVRLFQVIKGVPEEKRAAAEEAVAVCNRKFRFFRFVLDEDGDVNIEYDFPEALPDEAVGQIAAEVLGRVRAILEDICLILTRALEA